MNPAELRLLLEAVAHGDVSAPEAMERLRHFPAQVLDGATVDTERHLRAGFPEVIFGAGKTEAQVLSIAESLAGAGEPILATRVDPSVGDRLCRRFPDGRYAPVARVFTRPGRQAQTCGLT